MLIVSVLVLSSALLLAMVLNLTVKPERSARISTVCMITALICGLLIYGTGYAETSDDLLLSVIKTPLAVIRMFVGVNDLSAIAGSTLVSSRIGLVFFWLVHLCAFYSMASAAMFTLGAELLRRLRLLLSRRGELVLIYGINDNSITLGKDCLSAEGCSVVFAAESAASDAVRELNSLGASVIMGSHVSTADSAFLRKLHIGKRKFTVYAMDSDPDKCLIFAVKCRDALERAGIPAEHTCISLPGAEEIIIPMLQQSESRYGFGYVHVFDSSDLSARALIQICPPWDCLSFDAAGKATEDFSCAVIGFGRHGQAVLRQLIQNGQFAGSTFHAAVFSPGVDRESGNFFSESPELLRRYDITCCPEDGRSRFFYEFLAQKLSSLKLIAVCTGSDALNNEISDDLMLYLRHRHAENICVVQCGKSGARYQEAIGTPVMRTFAYTRAFLSAEEANRRAVLLNAVYDSSAKSAWEKWIVCPGFSKLSSRAAADYMPAFLRMTGSSPEEIRISGWHPTDRQLETLGQSEHLRWMAFYTVMGYSPMSRDQLAERAAEIARCKAEGKECGLQLTKDADERLHACLIPWEELDDLAAFEAQLTGRTVDYKQADFNNVLTLPHILLKEEE